MIFSSLLRKQDGFMRKYSVFALLMACLPVFSVSAQQAPPWDSQRYIRANEVRTDMEAYCLTVLEGDKIDKFGLKILSVIKNVLPARDMILVVGTDERFKHTGSVHGCSGSPVFIDGRLAGAMSAGWDGSIDPLYMVTPIEYMLPIGQETPGADKTPSSTLSYVEMSVPLNMKSIQRKATQALEKMTVSNVQLPLATNFSSQACETLSGPLGAAGLVPLQAGAFSDTPSKTAIEPGGVLALPLCSGDIRMAVVGTATEVVGNKVYGFGHAFTDVGAVELPMSAGIVHTVVVSHNMSFKLASAGDIVGTLRFDKAAGVAGFIGQKPKLIDLTVGVKRFDGPQPKMFRCKVAVDRQLTPLILRSAIVAAALNQGDLPPEHNVRYQCKMKLDNGTALDFGDISSEESILDPAMNLFALTAALMNNPFQLMTPQAISLDMEILPENLLASLWEARLSSAVVKPGDTVQIHIMTKTFRSEPKEFVINLAIPQDCPEGKYPLLVAGAEAYQGFLMKTAPQRFMVVDAQSLLEGLNRILNIPSDRIFVCLPLAQSGISIRNTELANLPQTKTALLTDSKRLQPTTPYQNFIETSIPTGLLLTGAATVELTIDKNP
jgi:hypothetical protein